MISDLFSAFLDSLELFVESECGMIFLALGLISIVFAILYRAMSTDCEVL